MFPCGHTFCKTCTDEILYRQGRVWYRPRLSCPMCRAVCSSHKVRYVLLGCKLEGEEAEKPVANLDHSSKILAVVKTLLTIRRKEPAAKTLVFSWVSVCFHSSLNEIPALEFFLLKDLYKTFFRWFVLF